MTRFGVVLQENTTGVGVIPALDAFAARSRMPEVAPIWSRLRDGEWVLDVSILADLRSRGVAPVIYVESGDAAYSDIRAGRYDGPLKRLARRADGCVVRWDQEPDGHGLARWQEVPALEWATTFSHVGATMRGVADIRMFWCVIRPAAAVREGYWPGDDAVQIIGFDRYRWDDDDALPGEQWAGPIMQCHTIAPGKKVWVGETGSRTGTVGRTAHLRESADAGADVVIHMNLTVGLPWDDHWEWTDRMDRVFAKMEPGAVDE